MQTLRNLSRSFTKLFVLMFFSMSIFIPIAQAGMVSTESMIAEQSTQWNKSEISSLMQRDEVKSQLESMGVDSADLQARIDALTDDEIQQMAMNLDTMPAGGDILGIALTVFIVLVITDLLGATDLFPFIKSIR